MSSSSGRRGVVAGLLSGYRLVVGLEVHCQLLAASKLLSASSASFGAAPNSQTSLVDAALPGTLPSLNRQCVLHVITTALALGTAPQRLSRFDRKHYFYADLPAGYQITQQHYPVIRGGSVAGVRIDRVQLEQDSGKSVHDLQPQLSHVDLNRAGVALIEVVTQPDMRSAEQAAAFVRKLGELLRHVGVCRAQMEDGSMRVDVNVSVVRESDGAAGERVEVKNLNSVRNVVRAIQHERDRQSALMAEGGQVRRETRTFDARSGQTLLLRSKEAMLDYRFMPEPDLPWLVISEREVSAVRAVMGETPEQQTARLMADYGLSASQAHLLQSENGAVAFFERLVHGEHAPAAAAGTEGTAAVAAAAAPTATATRPLLRSPQLAVNWLTSELFGKLRRRLDDAARTERLGHSADDEGDTDGAEDGGSGRDGGRRVFLLSGCPVSAAQLGGLLDLLQRGAISGKAGKAVLAAMMDGRGESAEIIVRRQGWVQDGDAQRLAGWLSAVLVRERAAVSRHLAQPNPRLLGFLTGQLIKQSGGQANPKLAAEAVRDRLEQLAAARQLP